MKQSWLVLYMLFKPSIPHQWLSVMCEAAIWLRINVFVQGKSFFLLCKTLTCLIISCSLSYSNSNNFPSPQFLLNPFYKCLQVRCDSFKMICKKVPRSHNELQSQEQSVNCLTCHHMYVFFCSPDWPVCIPLSLSEGCREAVMDGFRQGQGFKTLWPSINGNLLSDSFTRQGPFTQLILRHEGLCLIGCQNPVSNNIQEFMSAVYIQDYGKSCQAINEISGELCKFGEMNTILTLFYCMLG